MSKLMVFALYFVAAAILLGITSISVAGYVNFAREGTAGGVLPVFIVGILVSLAVFTAGNSFSPSRYPHRIEWTIAVCSVVTSLIFYFAAGFLLCTWYC